MDRVDIEQTKYSLQIEEKYSRRFLCAVIIYSIAISLLLRYITGIVANAVQVCMILLMVQSFFKIASRDNIKSRYLKSALIYLFIYTIFIWMNGLVLDYIHIKKYLLDNYGGFQYLAPLVLFLPVASPSFIRSTFYYSNKLGIAFLILLPLFILLQIYKNQGLSEMYVWIFANGCGFILLTSSLHPRKDIIRATVVMFIALIIVTLLARRNIMLTCIGFMLVAYYIYLFWNKKISVERRIFSFSLSIFILIGLALFYVSNESGMFSTFSRRASDNTREEVFLSYGLDMSENTNNWVFGRGINATYYVPDFFDEFSVDAYDDSKDDRDVIEAGYLQLVLNGGVLYLLIYLAVLVPAVIKGFFSSKNVFVKGCAALVFLWLIDMVPFGLPIFSFRYILVWICVGICYSAKVRSYNDEEIMKYINSDKVV